MKSEYRAEERNPMNEANAISWETIAKSQDF